MDIFFVYKNLAHPDDSPVIAEPTSLDERLAQATVAAKQLGTTIPWLVDSISNDLSRALGSQPNSEFILSQEGVILRMREWSAPKRLREDLEEFVGRHRNDDDKVDVGGSVVVQ